MAIVRRQADRIIVASREFVPAAVKSGIMAMVRSVDVQ